MRHLEGALEEDIGSGDLASACFPEDHQVSWYIEAEAEGTAAGVGIAAHALDPSNDGQPGSIDVLVRDGTRVSPGTRLLEGIASATFVTSRERVALNYLMHLSGIATETRRYVDRLAGLVTRVVDTRKTVPGLRMLEKYAVRCGGGHNHRFGLYDAAMLKDNHLKAAGDIRQAIARVRDRAPHLSRIEVECETYDQVNDAVAAGADCILLDNMELSLMESIVQRYGSQVLLEASGGIDLQNVRAIAETGVHFVSTSAITLGARPLKLHLEFS